MINVSPDGTQYALSGPQDAPVVILIHGLGLNKECWQWMIPKLKSTYRVLSYDLYGHGGSAPPPSKPNLSLFRKQLVELLDLCSIERGVIIGFSLGGMIARRFAQDTPRRTQGINHSTLSTQED